MELARRTPSPARSRMCISTSVICIKCHIDLILREKKSDSLSKAPHLSAILARTAAKTRKALPFKLPSFSASSSSIASSTSIKDFSPSSAQAFLERLGTFKPSTYTSKPESIDSAAAARCGWTNDGKDRLACSICSASWVVAGREGMNRDAGQFVPRPGSSLC
jgi:hypothetical protein